MPIDFEKIFNSIKKNVIDLINKSFTDYKNQAKTDGQNILDTLKNDLKKWTQQLANGQISTKDFEFQVLSRKEELEMVALKQAGIALIEIDRLKSNILNTIISTVTDLIKL